MRCCESPGPETDAAKDCDFDLFPRCRTFPAVQERCNQDTLSCARALSPVAAWGGGGWGRGHYCHAFLRFIKGNDGRGACDDSAPAAVRVRQTDGRGDQSITALTGVLLLPVSQRVNELLRLLERNCSCLTLGGTRTLSPPTEGGYFE